MRYDNQAKIQHELKQINDFLKMLKKDKVIQVWPSDVGYTIKEYAIKVSEDSTKMTGTTSEMITTMDASECLSALYMYKRGLQDAAGIYIKG